MMVAIIGLSGSGLWSVASAAGQAAEQQTVSVNSDVTAVESGSSLLPAPKPERSDYPNIGVSSRSLVWVIAQMHLFFGALVLAVPIFVLVIELIGFRTKDDRYDDMAHEFMKISLTAYAITALFGGALTLSLFLLYPDFMTYLTTRVFGAQMLVYAALFFLPAALCLLLRMERITLRQSQMDSPDLGAASQRGWNNTSGCRQFLDYIHDGAFGNRHCRCRRRKYLGGYERPIVEPTKPTSFYREHRIWWRGSRSLCSL
jgi:hypothetical protein